MKYSVPISHPHWIRKDVLCDGVGFVRMAYFPIVWRIFVGSWRHEVTGYGKIIPSHPVTDTVSPFWIMERAPLHRIISLNCRKQNHQVRVKVTIFLTELLPQRNDSSGTKLGKTSSVSLKAAWGFTFNIIKRGFSLNPKYWSSKIRFPLIQ